MKKEFNDTGLCVPHKHYMINSESRLLKIKELIDKGRYFTINRPRQFGKTTTIAMLETTSLLADYIVLSMSFEGVGDIPFQDENQFVAMFIEKIVRDLELLGIELNDGSIHSLWIFDLYLS